MVNTPALQKALDFVTEHPEQHDQERWATAPRKQIAAALEASGGRTARMPVECGTSYCLFGAALVLHGYQFVALPRGDAWNRLSYVAPKLPKDAAVAELAAYVEPIFARDAGQSVLELDDDQSCELADSNNTLLDLWALGWMFSGGTLVLPTVRYSTGPSITLEAIHTMIHKWARKTDQDGHPWGERAKAATAYLAELDAFNKAIEVD